MPAPYQDRAKPELLTTLDIPVEYVAKFQAWEALEKITLAAPNKPGQVYLPSHE